MQVEYENVQKEVDSLRSRLFELRESKILNSNLAKKMKNTEYFAIGLVHHSFSEVLHIIDICFDSKY